MASSQFSQTLSTNFLIIAPLLFFFFFIFFDVSCSKSSLCRTSCGDIPVAFPFSIDYGCGSPYHRHLLLCSSSTSSTLHLRTPSGTYPVLNISYRPTSPHLLISDPSMFTSCNDDNPSSSSSATTAAFALDTSTHLTLSPQNTFVFLNCSPSSVLIEPRLDFCRLYPHRCGGGDAISGAICDSNVGSRLCRDIPNCPSIQLSCCEYFPEASESMRMMLRNCEAYTSVYWRKVKTLEDDEDEVAEYGTVRVDFEIPVRERCRRCEDEKNGGGGICGFDAGSKEFLCLCQYGNVTTHCGDDNGIVRGKTNVGVIVGTTSAVSVAGLVSAGVVFWFLRKLRTNKVACGVQTNENRLF